MSSTHSGAQVQATSPWRSIQRNIRASERLLDARARVCARFCAAAAAAAAGTRSINLPQRTRRAGTRRMCGNYTPVRRTYNAVQRKSACASAVELLRDDQTLPRAIIPPRRVTYTNIPQRIIKCCFKLGTVLLKASVLRISVRTNRNEPFLRTVCGE